MASKASQPKKKRKRIHFLPKTQELRNYSNVTERTRLRRAARTIVTESKQNKEKKSWNDMHFLGDSLSATWADFLQNAEMRDAHGETCDVTQYINEDTVIYALGSTGFAGLAPGVMTSLGILGTFLGHIGNVWQCG